jgi:hypothetical protein
MFTPENAVVPCLVMLIACSAAPSATPPSLPLPTRSQAVETTSSPPVAAVVASSHACPQSHFVTCELGKRCSQNCFARARDACATLPCTDGCDIFEGAIGEPKQVFCGAPGFSSRMERCGGYSGWACPEGMRCDLPANQRGFDDASGSCVPDP